MKNSVIVKDWDRATPVFWTGHKWTYSYPEAKKYSVSEARRVCERASFAETAAIIVDYGLTDEHVAL